MPKQIPCLWFDGQAEEAAQHYTSIFPNSSIGDITRYGPDMPPADEGGRRPDRRLHPRRPGVHRASTAGRSSRSPRRSPSRSCARTRRRPTTTGTGSPRAARRACAAGSRTGSASPGRSSPTELMAAQRPRPRPGPARHPGHAADAPHRPRRDQARGRQRVRLTRRRRWPGAGSPLGSLRCRPPLPRPPRSSCPPGPLPSGPRSTRWSAPAPRCGCSTSAAAAACSPSRWPGSGHDVTVVDPSADALATLRRRADTAGVGAPRPRPPGRRRPAARGARRAADDAAAGYDLALCHYVLEVVDDPAVTLRRDRRRPAPRRSGERRDGQPGRRRPGPRRRRPPRRGPRPARGPRPGPGPRPARPAAASPPTTCSPSSRARACARARGAASPSSPTCSRPPPAPTPAPSAPSSSPWPSTSPYRDIATGLHVLAARP